jgi:hypothetical protein
LAQAVDHAEFAAALVEHLDVVAAAVRAPQADHGLGFKPTLIDDLTQHRLRIGEQFAGLRADHLVLQDLRIAAGQLPGVEEGRPVDVVDQGGELDMDFGDARHAWLGRRVVVPVTAEALAARVLEADETFAVALLRVAGADVGVVGLVGSHELRAQLGADQALGDVDRS